MEWEVYVKVDLKYVLRRGGGWNWLRVMLGGRLSIRGVESVISAPTLLVNYNFSSVKTVKRS
jgi:hypothetical protein